MPLSVVVVAKQFGLSLNDVGSALATFGDNNIRGAKAGTEFKLKEILILAAILVAGSYVTFILLLKLQIQVWPTFIIG